ncbi:pyruvate kinase [Bradyrhizobium diazoefficiens]|uniref:Uncharacterized protein n=3 Tax=Bradyrhizobium TaxID=374 RepID=A0A809YB42_9BRAD|nr:hypothetical protein BJS_08278 [Bradyrhizobium japonicum SEMIA 5079]APG15137.1 hypothetical protein BKD09_43225 [Bradyrhizobium japonicum]MCS3899473.1 pyruvate kinase [Bradyrhizobium japonicum USDA 38]MCS3933117.1 pyruvate kinase [Bradyrhizobium elkanii]BBO08223.1 hypothetical protein SG09_75730 [Bradyrhizobium ottawaense]BCA01069.1 hypothetical protein H12S4_19730 [Bradyrhizobium diazoefficiens]
MLVSIRALELEFNRPIGVLQDPQGPKIRIGRLDEGKLALDAGETVCFALRDRREAVNPAASSRNIRSRLSRSGPAH